MKKIILSLTALVFLSFGMINAQDLGKATEIYNNGATALMSNDKAKALDLFQKALKIGKACGKEGASLVQNCKNTIPGLILSMGKDLIKKKQYGPALVKVQEAIAKAKAFGLKDVEKEASALIPQIKLGEQLSIANNAYKAKDYKAAIAGYKKVLESDPKNVDASLRLGQVLGRTGDIEAAEKAFEVAANNGKKSLVNKQLSKLYLMKANDFSKHSKYEDAIKSAEKANSFHKNVKAYYIIGNACQKLNRKEDAIKAFEKFAKLSPKSKNTPAIIFTIGALYQELGNKEKAIATYKRVASHPKYGKQAKQMIKVLRK